VYGGDGLARIASNEGEGAGRVVLVPYVLPGELARIENGDDIHAALVEVLEPSADRVAAPCQFFARCGGCHYQHAPYEFQLARKVEILREQLRRVGKIEYEGEIEVVSGPPLGYRNRAQFHIEFGSGGGRVGYRAARSHDLIDVAECPISSPKVNETLKLIRERINDAHFPKFVHAIEIFTNEQEVQINATETDRPVARHFYEWMGSTVPLQYGEFRVSPRSFFQVNRFLIETMVENAIGGMSGDSAVDLYAGVGLFAIPLAKCFKDVTAVESGSAAIRDLEVNAERAGVKISGEQARVEDFMIRLEKTPDFVLADPPRAGLGKSVVANLNRLAPPRVTIVSCDPATLARDVAGLCSGQSAKYKMDKMTLVDLFPQTYHLETIAHLSAI
jgi:23S rRNA (uracil1939-C5)-methyltransferase